MSYKTRNEFVLQNLPKISLLRPTHHPKISSHYSQIQTLFFPFNSKYFFTNASHEISWLYHE